MTENAMDQGGDSGEDLTTDTGAYSIDDEDQLQGAETLMDGADDDILDEGYSPADRPQGSDAWGTTPFEQAQDETIEQRILQEEPDPNSAYGAPDNESGLDRLDDETVGGDDPDAIPAEDDFIGDTGSLAGRLVAPDEGAHLDRESESIAGDVAFAGSGATAEEAAMHIVEDDYTDDLDALDDLDDELGDRNRS
jgi:hypothetical protein